MPNYKILIINDNLPEIEQLTNSLAKMDCEISVVSNKDNILKEAKEFNPSLILLDIDNHLDGFEVCKTLKQDPSTKHILIMIVTTLNEVLDVTHAVAVGCDDFLSKPLNRTELLKRVEVLLKLSSVLNK